MSKKAFVLSLVLVLVGLVGIGFFTWGLVNDGGSPEDTAIVANGEGEETDAAPSGTEGQDSTAETNDQPLGFYDNVYVASDTLPGASSSRNVYVLKQVDNLESELLSLGKVLGMGDGIKVEDSSGEFFISKNPGEMGESRLSVSQVDSNGYFSYWKLADPQCEIQTDENTEACGGFDFSSDEASATAIKIVESISDFSANELEPNVFDSGNRIAVLVKAKIDGVLADQISWVFDFGKNGTVYSASGYLSDLENIGSYQTLSAQDVLARGNESEWKRFVLPGPPNSKVPAGTLPDPDAFTVAEKNITFSELGWGTYVDTTENKFYLVPSWIAGNEENVDTWNFLSLNEEDMRSLGFLE